MMTVLPSFSHFTDEEAKTQERLKLLAQGHPENVKSPALNLIQPDFGAQHSEPLGLCFPNLDHLHPTF